MFNGIKNMQFSTKIYASFVMLLVLLVVMTAVALKDSFTVQESQEELNALFQETMLTNDVLLNVLRMQSNFGNFVFSGETEELDEVIKFRKEADTVAAKLLEQYKENDDNEGITFINKITEDTARLETIVTKFPSLTFATAAEKTTEAERIMEQEFLNTFYLIAERKAAIIKSVNTTITTVNNLLNFSEVVLLVLGIISLVIGITVSYIIGRTVKAIVRSLAESVGRISETSREISSGADDLSERTEKQASNLEETAASMEELSGTVRQNSDNAAQANQLAASTRTAAEKGGQEVGQAVEAMQRIASSSQKIEDIVGVIDEIAFQTNLLALNAAVEAARAGEAGKGFAVVASEVRTLAQRSSAASKEIKALIDDGSNQVKSGVELVNRTGATLHEIVSSVKRVADIVAEIAAASKEQTAGLEQINTAVTDMDEMTQHNAALAEESAAAARSMSSQADGLKQMMQQYRLVDTNASDAVKPAARKR